MSQRTLANDENALITSRAKTTLVNLNQVKRNPLSSVENQNIELPSKVAKASDPGKVAKAKSTLQSKPKTTITSNPIKSKNIYEAAKSLNSSKDESSDPMDHDSHLKGVIQDVSVMGIQSPPQVNRTITLQNGTKPETREEMRVRLNIPDIDQEDANDPQACAEYATEIMEYVFNLEGKYMPDSKYMDRQSDLSWKMRSTLVNWLVEVHYKYKLYPETLFLAVNVMDRYLSIKTVSRNMLQLVGVTSLLIASKFEEIYSPSIEDFLYMCNDSYKSEEILAMESNILCTISFELGFPCSLNFLRRISKADSYDIPTRTVAKYLIEMAILDESFIQYKPSIIAASSMWLARKMLDKGDWNNVLEFYSEYTESQMEPCVNHMLQFLESNTKFKSVYKKYSSSKFLRASLFVEQYLKRLSGDRVEDGDVVIM